MGAKQILFIGFSGFFLLLIACSKLRFPIDVEYAQYRTKQPFKAHCDGTVPLSKWQYKVWRLCPSVFVCGASRLRDGELPKGLKAEGCNF